MRLSGVFYFRETKSTSCWCYGLSLSVMGSGTGAQRGERSVQALGPSVGRHLFLVWHLIMALCGCLAGIYQHSKGNLSEDSRGSV